MPLWSFPAAFSMARSTDGLASQFSISQSGNLSKPSFLLVFCVASCARTLRQHALFFSLPARFGWIIILPSSHDHHGILLSKGTTSSAFECFDSLTINSRPSSFRTQIIFHLNEGSARIGGLLGWMKSKVSVCSAPCVLLFKSISVSLHPS
ncbi:hypothetical protein B0H14DRAFT_3059171 [Mycena olivaceomarginata]|nr:hypothetical protein B0H14DRAFT_3059171 [Mycena olivaceomarginata]